MKDKSLKLLNDFANDLTLAENIKVVITPYNKSFKPRVDGIPARYEDANMLSTIIVGAESFLSYLNRNGYSIKKGKGKK